MDGVVWSVNVSNRYHPLSFFRVFLTASSLNFILISTLVLAGATTKLINTIDVSMSTLSMWFAGIAISLSTIIVLVFIVFLVLYRDFYPLWKAKTVRYKLDQNGVSVNSYTYKWSDFQFYVTSKQTRKSVVNSMIKLKPVYMELGIPIPDATSINGTVEITISLLRDKLGLRRSTILIFDSQMEYDKVLRIISAHLPVLPATINV